MNKISLANKIIQELEYKLSNTKSKSAIKNINKVINTLEIRKRELKEI